MDIDDSIKTFVSFAHKNQRNSSGQWNLQRHQVCCNNSSFNDHILFSTFLSLTSDTGSDHGPPVSTTVLTKMDREHLTSSRRRRRSYGKLFVTGRFFAWDKDKKKRVAAKRKTFKTEAVTHWQPLILSLYLVLLCFWRFLLFWGAAAVVLVVPMVVAVLFVLVVVLVAVVLLQLLVLLLLLVVLLLVAAMLLVLVEHVSSRVTGIRADFEKPEI